MDWMVKHVTETYADKSKRGAGAGTGEKRTRSIRGSDRYTLKTQALWIEGCATIKLKGE